MSEDARSNLEVAKTVIATLGSVAATAMVLRSVAQDYLPHDVQDYFFHGIRSFFSRFSNQMTLIINEYNGLDANEIYDAAVVYLGPRISPSTLRFQVNKTVKEDAINTAMERDEEVTEIFQGVKVKWVWICHQSESRRLNNSWGDYSSSSRKSEVRLFELIFHKKHRETVLKSYLPHILQEVKSIQQKAKTIKIHTLNTEEMYYNMSDAWVSTRLDHPSTFDTLAMDPDVKEMVLKDLKRFVRRRDHYRKVGKTWKRGYLLYGPPGTGKSSLIAAMANYLNFDIYDLELTDVPRNSVLRRLMLATSNRSILVVEDIDCTIDLKERASTKEKKPSDSDPRERDEEESKVTLSGFLNFVDGLWSSCGDERIIIFTTNHKEKLDPALLRPGRMDVHINMSYCTTNAFRTLASNYLGVTKEDVDDKQSRLLEEIEELIGSTEVTPAEVAEQLLKYDDDTEEALRGLIEFLHNKRTENEETKAKKENEKEENENRDDGDKSVIEER